MSSCASTVGQDAWATHTPWSSDWKGWPRGWTGVDGTAVPGMTSLGLQLQAHPELVRMRGGSP